jgi:hypothetical protein
MYDKPLFRKYDIFELLERQKVRVGQEISSLSKHQLLNDDEENLVNTISNKLTFNIPKLRDQEKIIDNDGEDVITFGIPFDGDAYVFAINPRLWMTGRPPFGEVLGNELLISLRKTRISGADLIAELNENLEVIKLYLNNLEGHINGFNSTLEVTCRQYISARKAQLVEESKMVADLGLPIKKRDGLPTTYSIPINRISPKVEIPNTTSEVFQPEPILSNAEYESILSILKNMVLVMEKNPRAFEGIGEEDLRTHFLVQLNGQYEGSATGETFNNKGKTDILITEKGKNVFIGECKFWRGESVFLETIDQLLSYSGWRDTKTAILIFNRNNDFTKVLNTIENVTQKHSCYKRFIKKLDETTFQYIFHQPEDINREMTITVMAFNVPSKSK